MSDLDDLGLVRRAREMRPQVEAACVAGESDARGVDVLETWDDLVARLAAFVGRERLAAPGVQRREWDGDVVIVTDDGEPPVGPFRSFVEAEVYLRPRGLMRDAGARPVRLSRP